MIKPKPDGGPAFPRPASEESEDTNCTHSEGMSLRDYFAGQALIGLLSLPSEELEWSAGFGWDDCYGDGNAHLYARAAYLYADAMLREKDANSP